MAKSRISNVNQTDFMSTSNTFDVLLPSNKLLKVRERNGDDEDTLSRNKDFQDGMAIPNFLSRLIVSEQITPKQLLAWKVRDKYYLLFKERVMTWGYELVFDYTFANGDTFNFTEDLEKFDWDFSKGPAPEKGEEGYEEERISPYPMGETIMEGKTSSGKNYRMEYLTGEGENKTLGKELDELTINDKLRIRNFQLQDASAVWHPIEKFNMLSAKDMAEIRTFVISKDPDFNMLVSIKHPTKNITERVSLLAIPDFFFPKA